jgi:hypothetical protein
MAMPSLRTHLPSDMPGAAEGSARRAGRLGRLAAWVLLAAAVAELGCRGPARALQMDGSTDLSLYYCCAKAWVQGADPYDLAVLKAIARQSGDAPQGLLNNAISPPVSFVVLAPLALLPWQAAKVVWLLANLALTAAMLHWLIRLVGMSWSRTGTIVLAALVLALAPIHTCLCLGQLALAAAALLVGALYFQRKPRTVLEGVLLALAGLLKPQMVAIFAVYWLYRRRWGALAVAAVLALAVTAVTVGRLQLAGTEQWFASWRANVQACFRGGACDYAAAGQARIFLNLQNPAYAIFGDRTAATAVAWAFTGGCLLAGLLAWRRLRDKGGCELLALALLGVAGLMPIYHVFYDAVILVLPLAWAVRSLAGGLRPYALTAIALILPFLVSGAAALTRLAADGRLPAGWADAWWWRTLVLPHQPYLLAVLAVVLVAALFRTAALSRAGCLPQEPAGRRPSSRLSGPETRH